MSMNGTEAHIRAALKRSLGLLGVERIDLCQLHRVDPATPIEETMRVFRALRDEGKIRHVGLSEVSVDQIERARAVVDIATVQNVYSIATRLHADVLAYCEGNGIGFIPFWPLHGGALAQAQAIASVAAARRCTVGGRHGHAGGVEHSGLAVSGRARSAEAPAGTAIERVRDPDPAAAEPVERVRAMHGRMTPAAMTLPRASALGLADGHGS